jgi:hypothetical protein
MTPNIFTLPPKAPEVARFTKSRASSRHSCHPGLLTANTRAGTLSKENVGFSISSLASVKVVAVILPFTTGFNLIVESSLSARALKSHLVGGMSQEENSTEVIKDKKN